MLRSFLQDGIRRLINRAPSILNPPPARDHNLQPRILSDEQILNGMGRFWELFNRLQSGRAQGVLGLCCVPDEQGLERYFRPGKTRKILKSPGTRFCSDWRQEADAQIAVLEQRVEIRHLVILISSRSLSPLTDSVESHCLRVIRSLAGIQRLGEGICSGRIRLHAWMEDERGKFKVLHPKLGVFVSPLALRGAT